MYKSLRSLTGTATRPLALAALSIAIVGALMAPGSASASAFQLKENSAKGLGRAYAGSATAGGDASVVVNNPAAMSDLKGTYLQTDITAINFSTKFSGSATDASGRPISGGNGGDGGTTLPVPALFFVTQLNDRVHVGAGFSVPFGFQTEYNQNWVGRYHAIKSRFQSLATTLSGSYDVSDNFSVGASFIAQKTTAELTSAINYNSVGLGQVQQALMAGLITPAMAQAKAAQINAVVPPGTDGRSRIYGTSWAYGWQLGARWKITSQDKLAFNYRSEISHTLKGTANFTVPPNAAAAYGVGGPGTAFSHTQGTAGFTTPAVVSLSYWHQAEKFGLGADVAWTKWDVFKKLEVTYANPAQPTSDQVFNWKNSWYVSFGGDYYLNDKVTLRAGVAYDSTPTNSTYRDPRVPDESRTLATFGIGYKASEHFEINASYAHIFVNNANINGVHSATGDVLTGAFQDYGNLLSLSAQYKF